VWGGWALRLENVVEGAVQSDQVDREAREIARRRIGEMKGFYVHAFVFAAVIALLIAVNALFSDTWWVQWVFLGWGIGVAAHGFAVFGLAGWETRKTDELTQELKNRLAQTESSRSNPARPEAPGEALHTRAEGS
jgi:protein-S-isoprenylcysteine O-methyltransferase Ste14